MSDKAKKETSSHKEHSNRKQTNKKIVTIRPEEEDPNAFKKDSKLKKEFYEKEIEKLQIELVKLQNWVKEHNKKIIIIFEGRDAAGKGGMIKALTEHLNPRGARIVALGKPSDVEKTQWYFQRYISKLPDGGEIVFLTVAGTTVRG